MARVVKSGRAVRSLGVALLSACGLVWLQVRNPIEVTAAQNTSVRGGENTGAITGTVTSRNGVEAGVWVIAETDDLGTKFRKIVVTDDAGRFALPQLPAAKFRVWVRGFGLVDSKPVIATPGQDLKLAGVVAPTPRDAAEYYPADSWWSLLEYPKPSEFPGTGPNGNGISPAVKGLGEWAYIMSTGCGHCHSLGNKIVRTLHDKEKFDSSVAAWDTQITRGQRGAGMSSVATNLGRPRMLKMLADWTDRIDAGEVPPAPPRPRGKERNVVVTIWDWGVKEGGYVHDDIATDRRNPTLNGYGPLYGVDVANDVLTILDPVKHTDRVIKVPMRDKGKRTSWPSNEDGTIPADSKPSRFYGKRALHVNPSDTHTPTLDGKGRVWMTTAIRLKENPAWCKAGSSNKYAKWFPMDVARRHIGYFDPKTEKLELIDSCYDTQHLNFAEDKDDTLYFSTEENMVAAWINTRVYDETRDAQKSIGWCPTVLDTNGDGKITKPWNEPFGRLGSTFWADPVDYRQGMADLKNSKLDSRVEVPGYGAVVSPADGAFWTTNGPWGPFPGHLLRTHTGSNPPETCVSEIYQVPSEIQGLDYGAPGSKGLMAGYGPRGIDVDRDGVIWVGLSSGHFGRFDRRKCKTLNGPTATGRHCNEGWTLYKAPGPNFKGTKISAENSYYAWVDQFNTSGLGENVPVYAGNNSNSLMALMPETGEWVTLRVPYPMGFYARSLDGRIDDPKEGWKGRGLWAAHAALNVWHLETGVASRPILAKFQLRPDPLAR